MLGAVLVWSVLHYPEGRSIILGQFAPLGFFSLAAALHWIQREADVAAGAILVMATIKPTLVFLVVPYLMLWAAARGRWPLVFGFLVPLTALSLLSTLAHPSWLADYAIRLLHYPSYTVGQSPVWLLTHEYLPFLGREGEIGITLLLTLTLIPAWIRSLRAAEGTVFLWGLCWTLVISNLVVPRSATTNYVLLLIPTIWLFAWIDRRGAMGRALVLCTMLAMILGYWWLHFATVVGNQEQPVMFLPLPLALGVTLLLARKALLREGEPAGIRV
jgi:hypothetical protein